MWHETYSFEREHLCYPEALQFFASYVGRAALAAKDKIEDDALIISHPNYRELLRLERFSEVLRFVSGEGPEPTAFTFSVLMKRFAFADEPQDRVMQLPGEKIGPSLCGYLLGYAYERYNSDLTLKLGDDRKTWKPELQFFRHVRNACFHAGTFDIWSGKPGKRNIEANPPENMGQPKPNIPEWRGHEIRFRGQTTVIVDEHDVELNGRRLINDYLYVPEVLPLLYDVGIRIAQALGI